MVAETKYSHSLPNCISWILYSFIKEFNLFQPESAVIISGSAELGLFFMPYHKGTS